MLCLESAVVIVEKIPECAHGVFICLLIVQKPERGIEAPLQLFPNQRLRKLGVSTVDSACLGSIGLDKLCGGPKAVIANDLHSCFAGLHVQALLTSG